MNNQELYHFGILGQKWGVRRFQNEDGTLTEAGKKRLQEKDQKWAKKNYDKIYNKAYSSFSKQLKKNRVKELTKADEKKVSKTYVNQYNRIMAEIMNKSVGDVRSPSGQVVQFVAKRGEIGVHMALTDAGYDVMKAYKNGIWSSGREAYKKSSVDRMRI